MPRDTRHGRVYSRHGKDYYSVTTVLGIIGSDAFVPWAVKVCAEEAIRKFDEFGTDSVSLVVAKNIVLQAKKRHIDIKKESAEIGRTAHKAVEDTLRGQEVDLSEADPRVQNVVLSLAKWAKDRDYKAVEHEFEVYSDQYLYAGTVDNLGYVNGELEVVDWKTGNGLWPESKLQVSAYGKAYNEMKGQELVKRGRVVRLFKDKVGYEELIVSDINAHFPTFMHAYSLWAWHEAEKT